MPGMQENSQDASSEFLFTPRISTLPIPAQRMRQHPLFDRGSGSGLEISEQRERNAVQLNLERHCQRKSEVSLFGKRSFCRRKYEMEAAHS